MITVIIPVYGVEPYLQQCVDSVRNQTYRNLEILLIDDGSPDRCGAICDGYAGADARVRAFHTENRGLSAARNVGLREARGEYIGFVDSDDWIEPDMYEALYAALAQTGADISVCGRWNTYPNRETEEKRAGSVFTHVEALKALLSGNIRSNVWDKLYRREVFRDILFPEGKVFEDVFVMYSVFERSRKTALIPKPEYHYRYRAEGISKTQSAKNLFDAAEAYLTRWEHFKEHEPAFFAEVRTELLRAAAGSISRVWRAWHGFSPAEKTAYRERLESLKDFVNAHIPLFGCRTWPVRLRLMMPFAHSASGTALASLYWINRLYVKCKPGPS